MTLEPAEIVHFLRRFNRWRRGDESLTMEDPKAIGETLDAACDVIDDYAEEIHFLQNKWKYAREMAARTSVERDEYCRIAGELVAAIRINTMRGTFATATVDDVDQWLQQWTGKLGPNPVISPTSATGDAPT